MILFNGGVHARKNIVHSRGPSRGICLVAGQRECTLETCLATSDCVVPTPQIAAVTTTATIMSTSSNTSKRVRVTNTAVGLCDALWIAVASFLSPQREWRTLCRVSRQLRQCIYCADKLVTHLRLELSVRYDCIQQAGWDQLMTRWSTRLTSLELVASSGASSLGGLATVWFGRLARAAAPRLERLTIGERAPFSPTDLPSFARLQHLDMSRALCPSDAGGDGQLHTLLQTRLVSFTGKLRRWLPTSLVAPHLERLDVAVSNLPADTDGVQLGQYRDWLARQPRLRWCAIDLGDDCLVRAERDGSEVEPLPKNTPLCFLSMREGKKNELVWDRDAHSMHVRFQCAVYTNYAVNFLALTCTANSAVEDVRGLQIVTGDKILVLSGRGIYERLGYLVAHAQEITWDTEDVEIVVKHFPMPSAVGVRFVTSRSNLSPLVNLRTSANLQWIDLVLNLSSTSSLTMDVFRRVHDELQRVLIRNDSKALRRISLRYCDNENNNVVTFDFVRGRDVIVVCK